MCQIQSHKLVARIQYSEEYGGICLCARVRLYIRPFCAEDLLQAVDGDAFALVHYLATAVVTLAGITFSVLVGEAGAHRLHNLVTYKVL